MNDFDKLRGLVEDAIVFALYSDDPHDAPEAFEARIAAIDAIDAIEEKALKARLILERHAPPAAMKGHRFW